MSRTKMSPGQGCLLPRLTGPLPGGWPGITFPPMSQHDSHDTGPPVIARIVRALPRKPGVYRMLDAAGAVLYVGKAKDLRARVSSYARPHGHSRRIGLMIAQVADIEITTTGSEAEALLLEASLIKRHKPPFNVLLRDDKSFPFILITDEATPRLMKHRGARRVPGNYYGPFANAGAVNRAIAALEKAFLLRTCSDGVFTNRTRPCLQHQIRRCAAPCTGEIAPQEYRALVAEARAFLEGRAREVQAALKRQMEDAAEGLDFERAAILRDRLAAMTHITAGNDIYPRTFAEADVFALAAAGDRHAVAAFFFRHHQSYGARTFFPHGGAGQTDEAVLAAFLAQFYDRHPIPRLILLSHDIAERALLEEALSDRAGHRVHVLTPARGEKRRFVAMALDNAGEALARKLADRDSHARLLERLAKAFHLPRPPLRIEVFDNSHIQGANAVGAMIVAGPEGFMKAHYRTFNIRDRDAAPGDDYAMMREVLRRRFARWGREKEEARNDAPREGFPPWPDLALLDGGRGQLAAALEIAGELRLKGIAFAAVAKGPDRNAGRETFHLPGGATLTLDGRDSLLYYLQRLRDEAHRFAIGAHRARRRRAARDNPLDAIAGIGPKKKKALLAAFGSAKAVARADVRELLQVEGISARLARAIHDHFHQA